MKKHLKKVAVTLVAALMTCALCLGLFVGCGGGSNTISVYIFCSQADASTNQSLINAWKEEYYAEHQAELAEAGVETLEVNFVSEPVDATYFDAISNKITAGTAEDVIYLSPKYVRSYAYSNYVLDLTDYINWSDYPVADVWNGGLSAYAYNATTGSVGDEIENVSVSADGTATFVNAEGQELSLYGVPKDYSSFGLMYNKNFFTTSLKDAYTNADGSNTLKPPAGSVKVWNGTGWDDSDAYINIGVTTKYYPFNFYNYSTYEEALNDGDPIAVMAQMNDGYEVTLPGWPGDTYATTGAEDTTYDSSLGYVTYTFAEYSAITYAVCMFARLADRDAAGNYTLMTWLNDSFYSGTNYVYGNDQYEGTLYLTAWLLGNDADIIDEASRSVDARYSYDENGQRSDNPTAKANADGLYTFEDGAYSYGINSEAFAEAYAAFLAYGSDWNALSYFAGNDSEDYGTRGGFALMQAGRCVFYGVGTWDLQNFNNSSINRLNIGIMPEPVSEDFAIASKVKDYKYEAAYYSNNYTSSWTEDSLASAADSDAGYTRIAKNTQTFNYDTYDANGNATVSAEWKTMMDARQEQWFARMDTVGYAVNANVLNVGEWKAKAAADLCAYLAMAEEGQLSLTYSGSQLSSLVPQCYSYVRYADGDDVFTGDHTNQFEMMISPDGNAEGTLTVTASEMSLVTSYYNGLKNYTSADVWAPIQAMLDKAGGSEIVLEGSDIWYFAVGAANQMRQDIIAKTPRQYITSNFPSLVPYINEYYADDNLSELATATNMMYKCLNMVSLSRKERNLQVRMAELNGAPDSCMYTFSASWINTAFPNYKGNGLLAYNRDRDEYITENLRLTKDGQDIRSADLGNSATTKAVLDALFPLPVIDTDATASKHEHTGNFYTPATYCRTIVQYVQATLVNEAILEEAKLLG